MRTSWPGRRLPRSALIDAAFPHSYSYADGLVHPGEKPGLGVWLDETVAAAHPYERAYLPVSRLFGRHGS